MIKAGETIHIRAKTLLVLKHLITHKNSIVTKQALLSTIWQDVVVQEQVLVQSIKEIRSLLGSDVIKTYPRQGYQWTATLQDFKQSRQPSRTLIFVLLAIILSTVIAITLHNAEEKKPQSISSFNVAFLPINNEMPDNIHHWVPLEGMQYFNQVMQGQQEISIVKEAPILEYLQAHPTMLTNNDDVHITLEDMRKLQTYLAADLIIQTKLLGYPQDFLLQYTFHLNHNMERGVIFSHDVNDALNQLADLVIQRYGTKEFNSTTTLRTINNSDFSNEAYTRGINHYHQRKYAEAIPFFTSALADNPNFLEARRNLAASYVNNGDPLKGVALMKENIEQAKVQLQLKEQMRSNLLLGVMLMNAHGVSNTLINKEKHHMAQAEQYILEAKTLALKINDKLFIAYAHEELGKIRRLQGAFDEAITLQKEALKYHNGFKGKYGQTAALIELARTSAAQSNHQDAEQYLQQAYSVAVDNGVATNQVLVLLAKADIYHLQAMNSKAKITAQQALTIATSANSDFLTAKVTAWLENNPHYEIN